MTLAPSSLRAFADSICMCACMPSLALQVSLQDGALICPETGRRFPVVSGIPNMLLAEDEV